MTININDTIRLERINPKHASDIFVAVDTNRTHLSQFLPWVGNMQSVADFSNYISRCEELYKQQLEVSFVIMQGEDLVGRIGLHYMNQQNKQASIGYWLTKDAEGKGIITQSCRALISYGFAELGLHRIEIKAAVKNVKSQAIPEKLNFKKEGILRAAEWVNNTFLDLYLYSMLAHEWKEKI
ncbi:MAG: GNAT family protein [Bacteroidota bacterium]